MKDLLETPEFKDICEASTKKWGVDAQLIVGIEEASEFQKVLTKILRNKTITAELRDNLIEEIVDLSMMIKQIKLMYDINDSEFNYALYNKINKYKGQLK